MLLSDLTFPINEEIPTQLDQAAVLYPKFISEVIFERFPWMEPLDRVFLLMLTDTAKEETIHIVVKDCQYSSVPLLHKLMQWFPEDEVRRTDAPDPTFPLPRQPPAVHCNCFIETVLFIIQ